MFQFLNSEIEILPTYSYSGKKIKHYIKMFPAHGDSGP